MDLFQGSSLFISFLYFIVGLITLYYFILHCTRNPDLTYQQLFLCCVVLFCLTSVTIYLTIAIDLDYQKRVWFKIVYVINDTFFVSTFLLLTYTIRVFPKSPNNKYYSDFRKMYYIVLVCVVLEFITLPLLAITLNLPKKMGMVRDSLFFLFLHLCDIFTIGLLVFYLFNKPTKNKGYNIQQDEENSNLKTDTIHYMDESNSSSNSDY
ncbi:hypothetical protein M0812_24302 [Anaeramoeba flamelloides]|uniref:Uncharacterized protein n=1 Tax=Anaeramoeba flamelloides TaxID=1746091 RepID=A0AAV7YGQ2_9EUKA|nr:hypothetical protein M0812_24302 [Anaeramoeba flamelloides]